MRPTPGNDLNLGILPGRSASLQFPRTMRDKHLYVCGSTGTGKSKLLESLIRQDIISWRKSKCGILVLDPHGSLYDGLIQWMAWNKIERPVIPIDLRQDDWVVSYNLLRERKGVDPQVLIDSITDSMAYVWGQSGTDQTPLFARWAGNIIRPLYEKNLTLIEAEFLIDRVSKQMRYLLTANLADKAAKQDWQFASTLGPRDLESQIGSTVSRLQRFIRNQTMRAMFGRPEASLDLGAALKEGHIILVNLATEHAKISRENADLFATLLMSDLWTATQVRGKREGIKPFYVYIDEFQRFVTPTIADVLDEARGYGLHFTLAHQFPNQLLNFSENGKRVYDSVMENASSKISFRLTHEENLSVMAQALFRGVWDPDKIKHELYSTKVMGYREELKEVRSTGKSTGLGRGSQRGGASGAGLGGTQSFQGDGTESVDPLSTSMSESHFSAASESASESWSESESESVSYVPMLIPVFGKELSHVQFQSLEEQQFRSMAVLFDQQERHCVARLVGMSQPVSIRTPTVQKMPGSPERTKRYLDGRYSTLPFALKGDEARAQLASRAKNLPGELLVEAAEEASTAKRKIK